MKQITTNSYFDEEEKIRTHDHLKKCLLQNCEQHPFGWVGCKLTLDLC